MIKIVYQWKHGKITGFQFPMKQRDFKDAFSLKILLRISNSSLYAVSKEQQHT